MVALLYDVRCLLLFCTLVQCVFLYKIYPVDDDQSNLLSTSFKENLNLPIPFKHIGYEDILVNAINDDYKDNGEELKIQLKRSIPRIGMPPIPQRRNNRPHWNPLVAAYKRCGELVSNAKRENCFKDAVQMLFVHKLRK
ncbi:unnamed protein product [Rotaria sp. Silwood2]|nr:unnamed protein product [Rotaria sp. Silwood2]CAF2665799.1 unnamed protein product [Rotaria sp. Silwood2]CAF2913218.1 unnamed protein product [Rotaria sp. Silwood2]CAF3087105.1 unnamed protein product [Rotaria sp. Silwood2]CAF3955140.1 unnamed protein product [Rotaria sp. Silwood2]